MATPPTSDQRARLADHEGLARFTCPKCGGRAYNGVPGEGILFRGSVLCVDCGEHSSVVAAVLAGQQKPTTPNVAYAEDDDL